MSRRKIAGMVIMGAMLVGAVVFLFSRMVLVPYEPMPLSVLERMPAGEALVVPGLANVPTTGALQPRVLLIEFSDFQCPYCRVGSDNLAEVMGACGDAVRVWFVNTPLPFHNRARDAAAAALAAHQQGRFFAYAERLFAGQDALDDASLLRHARELGLDLDRFERDRAGDDVNRALARDDRIGRAARVSGTPSFSLNGRLIEGSKDPEVFLEVVAEEVSKVDAEMAAGLPLHEALRKVVTANAGSNYVKNVLGW